MFQTTNQKSLKQPLLLAVSICGDFTGDTPLDGLVENPIVRYLWMIGGTPRTCPESSSSLDAQAHHCLFRLPWCSQVDTAVGENRRPGRNAALGFHREGSQSWDPMDGMAPLMENLNRKPWSLPSRTWGFMCKSSNLPTLWIWSWWNNMWTYKDMWKTRHLQMIFRETTDFSSIFFEVSSAWQCTSIYEWKILTISHHIISN